MIKHIVLCKFAPHVSDTQLELLFNKLAQIRHTEIPQIKTISFGRNCSIESLNKDFNYGLVIEFQNKQDRDIYVQHSAHIKFVKDDLMPLMDNDVMSNALVLDYEF